MGMGMSRFPDPYESRDDLGHATVFLVALLILVGIAAILFFGNAWLFAPVNPQSLFSAAGARSATQSQVAPVSQETPARAPTFTAPSPVPPLAGIPIQPTPNGTPGKTATPTPKVTPTSTAATSPTAKPQQTAAPTATSVPVTAHVGNTGGDGVYLRHTPRMTDKWVSWPDNTPLVLLGGEADGDGQHWLQVRDPRGNVGWVPAQFVVH